MLTGWMLGSSCWRKEGSRAVRHSAVLAASTCACGVCKIQIWTFEVPLSDCIKKKITKKPQNLCKLHDQGSKGFDHMCSSRTEHFMIELNILKTTAFLGNLSVIQRWNERGLFASIMAEPCSWGLSYQPAGQPAALRQPWAPLWPCIFWWWANLEHLRGVVGQGWQLGPTAATARALQESATHLPCWPGLYYSVTAPVEL